MRNGMVSADAIRLLFLRVSAVKQMFHNGNNDRHCYVTAAKCRLLDWQLTTDNCFYGLMICRFPSLFVSVISGSPLLELSTM